MDIIISRVGGTVAYRAGYLNYIRQVAPKGSRAVVFIHVPLVVQIPGSGELKSKPTQRSVKELLSRGVSSRMCWSAGRTPMTEEDPPENRPVLQCKRPECVIQSLTASTATVPLLLEQEGPGDGLVCRHLGLPEAVPDLAGGRRLVGRIKGAHRRVEDCLGGEYTQLHDAYLSVVKPCFTAGRKMMPLWKVNGSTQSS